MGFEEADRETPNKGNISIDSVMNDKPFMEFYLLLGGHGNTQGLENLTNMHTNAKT